MVRRTQYKRRAAVAVETAIVLPVMVFLLLMLIIGGMGAVRGSNWELDTDKTAPTQQEILQNAVLPLAVGMDTSKITIQAELIDGETGTVTPWDSSRKNPITLAKTSNLGVTNRLRITINYEWSPGVLIP